jgi:hypothetical protein
MNENTIRQFDINEPVKFEPHEFSRTDTGEGTAEYIAPFIIRFLAKAKKTKLKSGEIGFYNEIPPPGPVSKKQEYPLGPVKIHNYRDANNKLQPDASTYALHPFVWLERINESLAGHLWAELTVGKQSYSSGADWLDHRDTGGVEQVFFWDWVDFQGDPVQIHLPTSLATLLPDVILSINQYP